MMMEVNLLGKAVVKFLVGFAIFCAVWVAIFLSLFRLFPNYQDLIALSFIVGVFVTYIPFFIVIIRATVKGEGTPVAVAVIRDELESINSFDVPVAVKKHTENKYMLTWRYEDEKWFDILSTSGMQKSYQLIVKLDEAKKRATIVEVHKSIRWRRDLKSFKLSGGYFRGVSASYSKGAIWGIRESFGNAQVHDYKFVATEIRNPVINTLLRNGWDVRFALI